jgi:hypothetical protein
VAMKSDRIAYMKDGKIDSIGSFDEMKHLLNI